MNHAERFRVKRRYSIWRFRRVALFANGSAKFAQLHRAQPASGYCRKSLILRAFLRGIPRKRLNADGSEPVSVMHGVTIPRPVRVTSQTRIGKEITVDPTDTDEDYTAEILSATDVLEYRGPKGKLEALRAAVKVAGIRRIARINGVPRSQLQGFVSGKTTPNAATIAKIEACSFTLKDRSSQDAITGSVTGDDCSVDTYTVTGGTGRYSGATGSGTVTFTCTGNHYKDTWSGTISYWTKPIQVLTGPRPPSRLRGRAECAPMHPR